MTFPASPVDGQTAVVNGISYQYSAADNLWKRVPYLINPFGNANVAAYLSSAYPIVNDGALRLGTATGPDIYLDALNNIYVNHGGSNHTNLLVDAHASFSGNTTFSGNATITGAGNLTVNNLSNITVKSGGAIHLLNGAYLYGYDAWFSNLTAGNTSVGNISATGFYFANGTPFTSSTYGNTEVAAYLSGNVVTGNIRSTGYYWANGTPFISSSYGNTEVAAYLLVNSTITGLQSNAAFQANLLDVLTGNAATQGSLLDVLVANAAVQSANLTYLLSNAAAQEASLTILVSNAAAQSGAIDNINANIGAYETWANANVIGLQNQITGANTNLSVFQANVGSFYIWANTAYGTSSYANANVAAYLPTYTGNISAGNVTVTGNIVGGGVRTTTGSTEPANPSPGDMWYDTTVDVLFRYTDLGTGRAWLDINGETLLSSTDGNVSFANVSAAGYYWANGTPFVSSSYGNTEVAAYLAANPPTGTYSNTNVSAYIAGGITTANVVTTNGVYWANGNAYSSGGGVTNTRSMIMAMVFGGL